MTDKTNFDLSPEAENRLRDAKEYVKKNLNKKNQGVIEQDLWTPNKLYLEFSLCKDYILGAVYYLLAYDPRFKDCREKVIKDIAANISEWQDRMWDDFDEYYPNFPMKSADINAVFADPKTHDEVFRLSPNTVFYLMIKDDLLANVNHTHVRGKYTSVLIKDDNSGRHIRTYDPIIYTLNTYPLVLSEKARDGVGRYFAELFKVDVAIMSKDPATFGPEDRWIKETEQFYISKLGRWTKNAFMRDKIYEKVGHIEQHMGTLPMFDPRMNKILDSSAAWFKDSKVYARVLFDIEFKSQVKGRDMRVMVDWVLNHMSLFMDLAWIPTIATRFTPPPPEKRRTEEAADELLDALRPYIKS